MIREVRGLEIIVGLCEGAKLGIHALTGFTSLKTLGTVES